jgi:outer membrane protein OmpA-like peptidoglycan-associated protein
MTMRKLLTFILFFGLHLSYAQVNQLLFTLHNGDLDPGSVMRRYDILFDLEKATLRPEASIVLDSIADWMNLHPEFMIEVGNHTDYVNPKSSMRVTQARANTVRDYMVNKGVQATKITAVGYGDSRNIIPMSEILQIESKQLQQEKRAVNRRTEFKIIAVYAAQIHPFLLTDTIFWPGQVMRDERKIFFDLGKAGLRPESKSYLDTIVLFMKAHPGMKIEVDSHTDSRGSDDYNIRLSSMRAKCVVDYFVSQGIDPSRLRSKGFGETQPIWRDIEVHFKTPEEKEAKYQVNRRTEFKIISVK